MPPKSAVKKDKVDADSKDVTTSKDTPSTKVTKRVQKKAAKDDDAHDDGGKWANKLSEHEESEEDVDSSSGESDDSSETESDYEDAELDKDDKPRTQRQQQARRRPASEAMNFPFSDYDSLTSKVCDTSVSDLMRTVLVRAHRAGQRELKKYMEVGLKALNHECSFPERLTAPAAGRGFESAGRGGSNSYTAGRGGASRGGFGTHGAGRGRAGRDGRGGRDGRDVGRDDRDERDSRDEHDGRDERNRDNGRGGRTFRGDGRDERDRDSGRSGRGGRMGF
jgi:hypothetical protein